MKLIWFNVRISSQPSFFFRSLVNLKQHYHRLAVLFRQSSINCIYLHFRMKLIWFNVRISSQPNVFFSQSCKPQTTLPQVGSFVPTIIDRLHEKPSNNLIFETSFTVMQNPTSGQAEKRSGCIMF